eukprot:c5335_g1_i1.p1 GENE.c5335_g1_i1~~c5335_g1_i1.p1  ORF type:complete len:725 (-),score=216.80 c5335_g1_i1:135-2261(-)
MGRTRTRKSAPSRARQGLRRADTVHAYEGHPETHDKKRKSAGSAPSTPQKKIPKPYRKLILEALKAIDSPTGSSQIAIENYIHKTYEGTIVSRSHLKSAISGALESNLIELARGHKNSFKLKTANRAAVSSTPTRTPQARTSRTSRAAAVSAPTPTFQTAPAGGPLISIKWQYVMNNKCFGIFVDENQCVAADESGLVAQLNHEGEMQKVWKLEQGVKCLVSDSGFFFAGCNNGALYDLTSGVPRKVAQLEEFSEIFWIDIHQGRTVASDRAGHVALVNCEGETEWVSKSDGTDGWMVRVDESGVYHGHSMGVTKYDHLGNRLWHRQTAPVLFGWQEQHHVYASLVDPGCFDGEIAKRLSREGAKSGEVVVSLMWDTTDDLDLHLRCPCGGEICFMQKRCACGGELDVDMNTAFSMSNEPVENIFYTNAPRGHFKIQVVQYTNRSGKAEVPFEVCVKVRSEVHRFQKVAKGCGSGQAVTVYEFDLDAEAGASSSSATSSSVAAATSSQGEKPKKGVVKISKETGEVVQFFDAGSSVPSVTQGGGLVFGGVANAIKCFDAAGTEKFHLWTGAGSPMSMQYFNGMLFAVCTNKLLCMDVSDSEVEKARRGIGSIGRRLTYDSSAGDEVTEMVDVVSTTDTTGGVIVECVAEAGKLRIRPKAGQNFSASKNVQFPRNIREAGCSYVVGGLVDVNNTFYRVTGDIKKLVSAS